MGAERMLRIVAIMATLATMAMASPAAETRDQWSGFRDVRPHPGAKLHLPHRSFKFQRPGFSGRHGHVRPRHFGQHGFVLRFGSGSVLKLGQMPRFKHHRFDRRHGHRGLFSDLGPPRHVKRWPGRDRGFSRHRHRY